MRYYKLIENGYFLGVGIGNGGTEITKEEHDQLLEVIKNHPVGEGNCGYCLKADLTWEKCEMLPVEEVATEEDYQTALESLGVSLNA